MDLEHTGNNDSCTNAIYTTKCTPATHEVLSTLLGLLPPGKKLTL